MNVEYEYRAQVNEVRAKGADGEEPFVEGYGIVYDQEVELFPGFFEKISRGAFSESLKSGETVKSFVNHKSEHVLSTTVSNPALTVREDDKGVFFSSPIPPTTYGNDLKVNLRRGNISGASFAFKVNKSGDEWEDRSDGTIHRNIKSGKLYEIGPVESPAYIQTHVELKSYVKEEVEKRRRESVERRAATTTVEPTGKPTKKKPTEATTTTSEPTETVKKRNENILEIELMKLQLEKETL